MLPACRRRPEGSGLVYRSYSAARSNRMVADRSVHWDTIARISRPLFGAISSRQRYYVLPSLKRKAAQAARGLGYQQLAERIVRNPDIPSLLPYRCIYLEKRPGSIYAPVATQAACCMCLVEAGIPGAWCAPLPSSSGGRKLSRRVVAIPGVVLDSRKGRRLTLEGWDTGTESKEG